MEELTVIIPIEKWDDETKKYLDRALDSVFNQKSKPSEIIFGTHSDLNDNKYGEYLEKTIKEFEMIGINILNKCSDYVFENYPNSSSMAINDCVKSVKTKYFTVLELTDQFEPTWIENVQRYIETLDKDISAYLPICKIFNENGEFVRFLNEQWWANGFSKDLDLGYVDEEGLKVMFDMNLTGSIINKKDFDEIGGLKTNIKLYYWYEFLLRLVYNQKHVFVIPKSLYNHVYFKANNIEEHEAKFYWDSVQKEYYFNNQRELIYHTDWDANTAE
jgi:hypothetical protein